MTPRPTAGWHLANWLTAPENPYFSRAITNRVWANFFGLGLVESVDDLRLTNPPSNAQLMDVAARYLVDQRYDVKALMRAILQSATYGRSSQPLPANADDQRFYSRYYPRRMMAEVLLDALSQVTAAPTNFGDYAVGWRALQLPDVERQFILSQDVRSARRDHVRVRTDGEAEHGAGAAHFTVTRSIKSSKPRIIGWRRCSPATMTNEQIIDEAYLSALSRLPSDAERELLAALAEAKEADRRQLVEDLYWSILSSKEFLLTTS